MDSIIFFSKTMNFRLSFILGILILFVSQITHCIYRKDAFHFFDKFLVLDNVSNTKKENKPNYLFKKNLLVNLPLFQ